MCMNPLRMRNPHMPTKYISSETYNRVCKDTGEITKRPKMSFVHSGGYSFKHNHENAFLNIPCGHCPECVAVKQQSYVQRVYMETKFNHVFFATLTYDNKHLPKAEVFIPARPNVNKPKTEEKMEPMFNPDGSANESAIAKVLEQVEQRRLAFDSDKTLPSSELPATDVFSADEPEGHVEIIPYADIHHLQLLFKRMRDNNTIGRPFRYIAVTERGKRRARPHAHIMFLIPKHEGDNVATCDSINESLRDMLLRYWSTNVGTRKNPIYERNFTFRQRWLGNKLYRNFDCHYVNPILTTGGVNDVTYYVTKYLFKESKKEEQLRKMLFKHLVTRDEDTGEVDMTLFYQTWDLVKSRICVSKGLGLDGVMETVTSVQAVKKPLDEYAYEYQHQLDAFQDLPGDDYVLTRPSDFHYIERKRRIIVPNFEIMQEIIDNSMLEKEKGRFVFVNYVGKHFTLAKYYQDRCLSEEKYVDLFYSCKPEYYNDPYRPDKMSPQERDKKSYKYQKSCELIDKHEIMDARFTILEEQGQDIDPYSVYKGHSHKLVLNNNPRINIGK